MRFGVIINVTAFGFVDGFVAGKSDARKIATDFV